MRGWGDGCGKLTLCEGMGVWQGLLYGWMASINSFVRAFGSEFGWFGLAQVSLP